MKTIKPIIFLTLIFVCFEVSSQNNKSLNFTKFMSRQDMVWDTLTGYFYDGIPTGNGLLGMVLHRQDAGRGDGNTNTLLFETNRSDVVDSCYLQQEGYNWERKAIGKFAFTPKGKIIKSNFRLNLYDATATGKIITDLGEISIKFFTHATEQVQVIEYEWSGRELEPNIQFLADNAGCMLDFVTVDFQEKATYDVAKPFVKKENNGISTHFQPLNAGRSYTVGWTQKKEKNKITLYHTISYSHPEIAKKFKAEDVLEDKTIQNLKFNIQHLDWWHSFYEQSAFVSLSDSLYENFYWAQLYKIGSTMRENLQMMDLMGPWYSHTPWRAIWWNWNTQGIYYPLSQINHPELVKPLINALHKNEKSLEGNLAENLRSQNAIGIGRSASFDLKSTINMEDGPPLYAGREPGNLTWVMHVYYQNLKSTGDENQLKTKFFPLLKRAINLYLALAIKKDDGKYHLPLTMSPEYKPAEDCNYDLSLFKWGLKTLIEINQKYQLNDNMASKWEDYDKNLIDFQVSKNGFSIGKDVDLTESHRHFSHLMMVYPLELVNLLDSNHFKIAQKSLNHWLKVENGAGLAAWSHILASSLYTKLNQPQNSKIELDKSFGAFSANTMYREAGQCAETPIFWMKAFTDMLLKNSKDTIQFFPASLTVWKKISFDKIRISGAFLVSASCENEKIQGLKIFSEKGGNLTLLIPPTLKSVNLDKVKILNKTKNYVTCQFEPNATIEFSSKNSITDFKLFSETNYKKGNVFGKKLK